MKKQTSVEWLINELYVEMNLSGDGRVLDEILEQAKEMHKQEIIDAVGVGSQFDRDYLYGYHDKAEQYYQETYVSKGSDDHISKMVEPPKQETLYTEEQVREAIEMARGIKDDEMTFDISSIIGCGEVCTYGWKEEYTNEEIIQSLKQPKKD